MLPSCGHFKNIPCPFYKLALCVRPHCPYRHQNPENGQQRHMFIPLVEDTESLLDTSLSKSSYHDTVSEIQENTTYIPTPVDISAKPVGILKTSSNIDRSSTSYVPEYKPTPISKLKEFNGGGSSNSNASVLAKSSSKSQYSPDYTAMQKRKKNVEEYDPTEVKCVSKKSVTFADQTDSDGVPVVLISSDDDDIDTESAPKFSDDDYEEEVPSVSNITKQIPDVIAIQEDVIEEPKIDEFSVVDKILVDCKKNEMLLNSYKKSALLPKINARATATQKPVAEKNKVVLSQKSDKNNKSTNIVTIKVEKDTTDVKDELLNLIVDPKPKKNENSKDFEKNELSEKSKKDLKTERNELSEKSKKDLKIERNELSEKPKKDLKTEKTELSEKSKKDLKTQKNESSEKSKRDLKIEKNESSEKSKKDLKTERNESSEKSKKNLKTQKNESSEKSKKVSHSSNIKESEKSKHSKKVLSFEKALCYEITKVGPITKLDNHSAIESSDKIKSKKRTDDICIKQIDRDSSPKKKKSKYENVHNIKSLQQITLKEKNLSTYPTQTHLSSHSVKRKSDGSNSEQYISKSKSSPDAKKFKSNAHISPSKKTKFTDSSGSDNADTEAKTYSDIDENLDLSLSDSDPDEECRRIFNECYPEESVSPKEDKKEETEPKSSQRKSPQLIFLSKKRYAHPGAAELKAPSKQAKPEVKRPLNPAQVMHNRFAQYQAKFAQLNENKDSAKSTDKKRINFAPNQNLLDAIRNKNQGISSLGNFTPLPPTVSKSLKVTKRTAHVPETVLKPRPIIPAEYGSKVPANIRQKYLNAFIDECLKFCLSEDEAYDTALEEEKQVYTRSSSRTLYLNIAANALKRLRRKAEDGPESTSNNNVSAKSNISKPSQKTVSHETLLNGPIAQRRSFSMARKKEIPEIRGGPALYEYLLQYVMTPEQLKENSYPLPHPTEKDRAIISGVFASRTLYCNDAFKRTCSRCHKTYYVNVDGDYVRDEECDFHWGRIWKKRIAGSLESRYSCCQGDAESDGCCVSPGHVFDGSEAHVLKGYVRTLPKTPPSDNYYGIYALDCEMCYTTAGLELTRITVVDTDLKPVYESFVKPQNKVLDYNTRFSGITEDDLKNVRTTLHDVQAVLLCIFNDKTILIGHSLESDFKALKLFHNTVIDTSVVFPHKSGLPYKRALKTLMAENLNKIIQNDVGGHDSQEDAIACMELMLWKVKEDVRSNR